MTHLCPCQLVWCKAEWPVSCVDLQQVEQPDQVTGAVPRVTCQHTINNYIEGKAIDILFGWSFFMRNVFLDFSILFFAAHEKDQPKTISVTFPSMSASQILQYSSSHTLQNCILYFNPKKRLKEI